MGLNESSNFDGTILLWILLSGSILLNLFLALRKKPASVPPAPVPEASPLQSNAVPGPTELISVGTGTIEPQEAEQAAPETESTEESTEKSIEQCHAETTAEPEKEQVQPVYREDAHPSETLLLSENEERFVSRLANQVAHDIRSPLAHLLAVASMDDQTTLDEHLREGIRDSANRLRELARHISSPEGLDALLQRPTPEADPAEERLDGLTESHEQIRAPLPLAPVVEAPLVQTEQMLDSEAHSTPTRVRKPRASPTQKFEDESPEVQLLEPILETLATRTQDRTGRLTRVRWWNGNGFGIFVSISRRKFVSDFLKAVDALKQTGKEPLTLEVTHPEGKTLEIHVLSPEGSGIKPIRLSLSSAPGWFADQILLPKDCNLIILDDDPSIHRLWAQRLKNLPCKPVHLRDHESAVDWYRNNWVEGQNTFWLCDHELGVDSRTGLETIELLGVQDEALLVTSRFEDPEVQARVIRQGVRILPKLLAPIAPIEWSEGMTSS